MLGASPPPNGTILNVSVPPLPTFIDGIAWRHAGWHRAAVITASALSRSIQIVFEANGPPGKVLPFIFPGARRSRFDYGVEMSKYGPTPLS